MALTAQDILGTPIGDARALFPGTLKDIRKRFRSLAVAWQPDICKRPEATAVFAHLVLLRDAATARAPGAGHVRPTVPDSVRVLETADGRRLAMTPWSITRTDTGEILVGARTLTTVYRPEFSDFARGENQNIGTFRFADDRMKSEMSAFLPRVLREFALQDGGHAIVVERKSDEVLLSDLLRKTGPLAAEHVAWIGSGLLNIASWMGWTGLCHGAIDPQHILVSPATHSVTLAAGWSFVTRIGERPAALPARTVEAIPALALSGVKAGPAVDLELIRLTLREALGNPTGARLLGGLVPKPMALWLTFPPQVPAHLDYAAWHKALAASWGKRKFVVLSTTPREVYAMT